MSWKLVSGLVLSGLSGLLLVNMALCLCNGQPLWALVSYNGSAVLGRWADSLS